MLKISLERSFYPATGRWLTYCRRRWLRQVEQFRENDEVIRIGEARRKSRSFVQIIHRWRDEYLKDQSAPEERVVVFDEAQRAWTAEQTSTFMQTKKGQADFNMSEPEFTLCHGTTLRLVRCALLAAAKKSTKGKLVLMNG